MEIAYIFSEVAHRNHGKENIRVLYCLKPQGIKGRVSGHSVFAGRSLMLVSVEYRGQFYFKIEHNSEKLEDLVPKAIRFMQFKEVPRTDKVCKDLHDSGYPFFANTEYVIVDGSRSELERRNFSLHPRLYMKVMKKNREVKLDIKANRKRKDNEGRKYNKLLAIKGVFLIELCTNPINSFSSQVDHAEIGFTAYGKDTEQAKRSMLEHLDYKELTKRNQRSISALGGQDNQKLLEQIFASKVLGITSNIVV